MGMKELPYLVGNLLLSYLSGLMVYINYKTYLECCYTHICIFIFECTKDQ